MYLLSSLRATAAPLWESDVGGTSLLASFRHVFAGSRHVFAAFRRQTESQAGKSDTEITPTSEVSRFWRKKHCHEQAQAAKERPRSRQRDPKRAPRGSSWRPRGSQRSPREPPKVSQRDLGDHFYVLKLKKSILREPSAARLARGARSKRLSDDFRNVRANAEM